MIHRVALTLTMATMAVVFPGPAPAFAATTCHGQTATIEASTGDIVGTEADDVIVASGSVETIKAGDGDDTICLLDTFGVFIDAGSGDDVVDTHLAGPQGDDTKLGPGSDLYLGGPQPESVFSGRGNDDDTISTAGDKDRVFISSAHATVSTGGGHDGVILQAGPLVDGALDLGRGRDFLDSITRSTSLSVDMPHHRLRFANAHYSLRGVDIVDASARTVRLVGDGGPNVFTAVGCAVSMVGGGGDDRMQLATLFYTSPPTRFDCSHVRADEFGGPGDDVLVGNRGNDTLIGGPGVDKAYGEGGHDACHAELRIQCEL